MTDPGRVYLVEDEAIIVMELKDRLPPMGYRVVGHAARGEQALEAIAASSPDVVLLDIHLAGALDGIATAHALRARFPVPIVFVTGNVDADTLARAKAAEPAGMLAKPFREDQLEAVLAAALRRRRTAG